MDMSELAQKMLEWEEGKKRLVELEKEIKTAVLDIGKTQTVGNVRVTFSAGRKSYDYETPGKSADAGLIETYTQTTTTTSTDWRQVCKDAEIEPVVISQSAPSASVKLL
jgi:hypothetical protein